MPSVRTGGVLSETYKMEVGTYKMVAAAGGGHFIRPGRLPCGAVGAARALIKYNPYKRTQGTIKYNPYNTIPVVPSPAAARWRAPPRHHPWRGFRIRTSSGTQSPVYSSDQTGPNGTTATAPAP